MVHDDFLAKNQEDLQTAVFILGVEILYRRMYTMEEKQ